MEKILLGVAIVLLVIAVIGLSVENIRNGREK